MRNEIIVNGQTNWLEMQNEINGQFEMDGKKNILCY